MSKYQKEGSIQDSPTLTIDVLQNVQDINDRVLCKDITSVVRQMSPANQLEILKKIQTQPNWFTFIRFDEWSQNQERMNIIHTKISNSSLDREIMALRQSGLQPNPKNCWFLMTNLLLAVMDMEHRLDFFQSLSTKNIYLNGDRSMSILNPYFRDNHLQKILEDVIIPSKNCPGWREEFGQSYYARMAAIESNKQLADLHYVHQNYVKDMLRSVGIIVLAFLSKRDESGYYVNDRSNSSKIGLRNDIVTGDLNMLDQVGVDSDLVDLLEYILKYEPPSAVEMGPLLNEAQYNKMLTCMKDATLVCSDPKAARDLFLEIKGYNQYDPKYKHNVPIRTRNSNMPSVGPNPNYQLPPGFVEADPAFKVFAALLNPGDKTTVNTSTTLEGSKLAPARELSALKEWTIGHEKKKEVLPEKIDFLRSYTLDKKERNKPVAEKVDFLKMFMRGKDQAPAYIEPPKIEIPRLHCGCHHVCSCKHVHLTHMHHHRLPGHLHMHYDNPLYSPYSHLYYMGSPLTGREADLLNMNPVTSRYSWLTRYSSKLDYPLGSRERCTKLGLSSTWA